MTINKIIRYTLAHPLLERSFPGWSPEQVTDLLISACRDNELYASTGPKGAVEGIIIAEINHDTRNIHIVNVLCSSKRAFVKFVRGWQEQYPAYSITGNRGEQHKRYTLHNFRRYLRKPDDELIPTSV